MNERGETLDELLNDPIVQMVMKRDNVRPEELRRSLERELTLATRSWDDDFAERGFVATTGYFCAPVV